MDLVKQYPGAIDQAFCDALIQIYNESDKVVPGKIHRGVDLSVKKTFDLHFRYVDSARIKEYDTQLHLILNKHINEYLKGFELDPGTHYADKGFQIQKYTKNDGFYVSHHDEVIDLNSKEMRMLTFLFYLNTVDEGGETEFFETTKIKPEQGKLVLFPAHWCFPHKAIMPVSHDKYIVTGWLYKSLK